MLSTLIESTKNANKIKIINTHIICRCHSHQFIIQSAKIESHRSLNIHNTYKCICNSCFLILVLMASRLTWTQTFPVTGSHQIMPRQSSWNSFGSVGRILGNQVTFRIEWENLTSLSTCHFQICYFMVLWFLIFFINRILAVKIRCDLWRFLVSTIWIVVQLPNNFGFMHFLSHSPYLSISGYNTKEINEKSIFLLWKTVYCLYHPLFRWIKLCLNTKFHFK